MKDSFFYYKWLLGLEVEFSKITLNVINDVAQWRQFVYAQLIVKEDRMESAEVAFLIKMVRCRVAVDFGFFN